MRYRFYTADVFTDRPYGGNPLAVLPDAAGLSTAQMRLIAREFSLSETAFVLPPEDPRHFRRVRIFTPAKELPFAGHPTVGTATAMTGRAARALPARIAGSARDDRLSAGSPGPCSPASRRPCRSRCGRRRR